MKRLLKRNHNTFFRRTIHQTKLPHLRFLQWDSPPLHSFEIESIKID